MSTPLSRLETALQHALVQGAAQRPEFSPPTAVIQAAEAVKAFFNAGAIGQPPVDRKRQALTYFLANRRLGNVGQAYLVAWGLADTEVDSKPLIERTDDFQRFLGMISDIHKDGSLPAPVWRGLLGSYFSYPVEERDSAAGRENWRALRRFLQESFEDIWNRRRMHPDWMTLLRANRNLFDDHPADPYAKDLLAGRLDEIRLLVRTLVIPQRSWFVGSLVMAQVRYAVTGPDATFKSHLPAVCNVVREHKLYASRALAMLLKRYYDCEDASEDLELRDLALEVWGSPKLPSNDGKWSAVGSDVKGMVLKWLLGRDLVEFFEVLAADGRSDKRRLNFWMRYLDAMRDAYFVLGTAALTSRDSDHTEIIRRNQGRVARLRSAGSRDANAFIMLFGRYVVVEFGVTGNKCFCYDRSRLPFELDSLSFHAGYGGLKQYQNVFSISHVDTRFEEWEDLLARELAALGLHSNVADAPRRQPEPPPAAVRRSEPASDYGFAAQSSATEPPQTERAVPQFSRTQDAQSKKSKAAKDLLDGLGSGDMFDDTRLALWAQRNGFQLEDNRGRDGALKIHTDDRRLDVNALLLKLGFRYSPNKKFWWKS